MIWIPEKSLLVEHYPGTVPFCSVLFFNLLIWGSPCVLHREQGRKIPSACMGVRGRFNTPPLSQSHNGLGRLRVRVKNTHAMAQIWRSGAYQRPATPSAMMVLGATACPALPARWPRQGLAVGRPFLFVEWRQLA